MTPSRYRDGWSAQAQTLGNYVSFFPQRPGPRTLLLESLKVEVDPHSGTHFYKRCTEPERVVFPPFCLAVLECDGIYSGMMMLETTGEAMGPRALVSPIYTPNGGGSVCLGGPAVERAIRGADPVDLFWNTTWYGPRSKWNDYLLSDGRLAARHRKFMRVPEVGGIVSTFVPNDVMSAEDLLLAKFPGTRRWEWR